MIFFKTFSSDQTSRRQNHLRDLFRHQKHLLEFYKLLLHHVTEASISFSSKVSFVRLSWFSLKLQWRQKGKQRIKKIWLLRWKVPFWSAASILQERIDSLQRWRLLDLDDSLSEKSFPESAAGSQSHVIFPSTQNQSQRWPSWCSETKLFDCSEVGFERTQFLTSAQQNHEDSDFLPPPEILSRCWTLSSDPRQPNLSKSASGPRSCWRHHPTRTVFYAPRQEAWPPSSALGAGWRRRCHIVSGELAANFDLWLPGGCFEAHIGSGRRKHAAPAGPSGDHKYCEGMTGSRRWREDHHSLQLITASFKMRF